jgi:mRNA interferase MazF
VIIVAPPGEFGKPRPAVIIQADLALESETVTFLPITSDLEVAIAVRVPVAANASNGLRRDSQVMVDRIQTSSLSRIGGIVGSLNDETMQAVENALLIHLGLI